MCMMQDWRCVGIVHVLKQFDGFGNVVREVESRGERIFWCLCFVVHMRCFFLLIIPQFRTIYILCDALKVKDINRASFLKASLKPFKTHNSFISTRVSSQSTVPQTSNHHALDTLALQQHPLRREVQQSPLDMAPRMLELRQADRSE